VEREEEAACVAKPREVQQGEYERTPWKVLRKRAEEYCGKEVPMDVQLLEWRWMTEKMIISYLHCKYGARGSHIEDNRGQGVILFWKWKELS